MSNIPEIQRLLNEKADLQAQINITAFDGRCFHYISTDRNYFGKWRSYKLIRPSAYDNLLLYVSGYTAVTLDLFLSSF